MIAAVTGASGHVGGNLVRCLLSRGYEVRALSHKDERAIRGLDVEILRGDVRDKETISRFVRGVDLVFHLAAFISITNYKRSEIEETNVEGTRNIIDACIAHGIKRLVHFSSIHALSPLPKNEVVDESRSLVRADQELAYDFTKANSEKLVMDAVFRGLDAVILNPTAIIGPFDFKPSLAGEMILMMLEGRLAATVEGGFDWVDVRDVAQAACIAAERGRKGERYILSGNWYMMRDICSMLAEVSGCVPPSFNAPMWLARLGAPFMSRISAITGKRPLFTSGSLAALRGYRHISSEKARRELDHVPRPIRDTLKDTYLWFADNGLLKNK
jgi:dihydroflavonol-4-reductase